MLASEPRLLVARDIEDQKICYAPIEVKLKVRRSTLQNVWNQKSGENCVNIFSSEVYILPYYLPSIYGIIYFSKYSIGSYEVNKSHPIFFYVVSAQKRF